MLLFDWKKVFDTAGGSIYNCNLIMEMLIKGKVPKNKYDPIYKFSSKNFRGNSFLVHPEFLLYNSYKYDQKEICMYYALASLRSLSDYYADKTTTLDALHCPVPLEDINDNRLLIIEDDTITFIYEEVTLETIH
jgi:hypothetical protein